MATTGRRTVAPGEVIASEWGNDAWDQTIQCFDTAADRDAQYPAPHNGAMCYVADVNRFYRRKSGVWSPATQSGAVGVPVTAAVTGTVAVTFPVAFSETPRVVATVSGNTSFTPYIASGLTSTGVVLGVRNILNTSSTVTVIVNWMATTD